MLRRDLVKASIALATVVATCGCSAPGSARGLTVGLSYVPNVQFAPFYLAHQDKLFEERDLQVRLRHHGQQEDLFGALLSGQEDIVFASADEAMVAASQGRDLKIFATAYQTYPIQIMSLEGRVARLGDLAGKRLGLPGRFGSNYYAALAAISEAGLTTDEVELVDIGFTQVQALTTGRVDAIVGFVNNEYTQLRAQKLQVTGVPVSDPQHPRLVGPSLVTRADVDIEWLKGVAHVMAEAEQRIQTDPEKGLAATARQVPALADQNQRRNASAVLEATSQLWLRNKQVSVEVDAGAIRRMGSFLQGAGIIKSVPEGLVQQL